MIRHPANPNLRLTDEAFSNRMDFTLYPGNRSCTCFQSAPCGYCMHPHNPDNQDEDDSAWQVITPEELIHEQRLIKARRFEKRRKLQLLEA